MELLVKALAGAIIVVFIQLLARTQNAYLAGLVPLFPTFALIAHYIVGTTRTTEHLKQTIVFGVFSLVPYLIYLLALYALVDRCPLKLALLGATIAWGLAAVLLIFVWQNRA